MKIGNLIDKTALAGNSGAATRPGVGEAASQSNGPQAANGLGAPVESATVKLSSTAATLMASGTPEFNAQKVAAVRQSIAEGTFRPQPEAIADKLIANAQELLTRPSAH